MTYKKRFMVFLAIAWYIINVFVIKLSILSRNVIYVFDLDLGLFAIRYYFLVCLRIDYRILLRACISTLHWMWQQENKGSLILVILV